MINAVFFDCDSTLSAVEGIDLLARRAGVHDRIAPLTQAAMEGRMTLEEVYRRRLELIRPDIEAIAWLGREYLAACVAGAREVIASLHRVGRQVHIISGGIRQAVAVLAQELGVDAARVHAVDLYFDAAGAYAGFDENSPLARSGGKAEICRQLLPASRGAVMVGDGVTDLEAAAAGVTVIGFGGIVRREAVVRRAAVYIDAPTLLPLLDVVLTPAERDWLRKETPG